jgi:hypothetical protein
MLRIRLGLCTRNFQKKHKNMHIHGAHFSTGVSILFTLLNIFSRQDTKMYQYF